LIIAWFAEHLVAFAYFDIPLPFLIRNFEHVGPEFAALRTYVRIQDKWDTAFGIQHTFPPLPINLVIVDDKLILSCSTVTADELTSTERAPFHVTSQLVKLTFRHATVVACVTLHGELVLILTRRDVINLALLFGDHDSPCAVPILNLRH
jgi:hypothetical protein